MDVLVGFGHLCPMRIGGGLSGLASTMLRNSLSVLLK